MVLERDTRSVRRKNHVYGGGGGTDKRQSKADVDRANADREGYDLRSANVVGLAYNAVSMAGWTVDHSYYWHGKFLGRLGEEDEEIA